VVFAGLFYVGGILIEDGQEIVKVNLPDGTTFDSIKFNINPEDVMIALFAIFFGAT
jgi:hypothetical protein